VSIEIPTYLYTSFTGKKSWSINVQILFYRGTGKAGIGSWDWKLKEDKCTYHALFPRSWTIYDGKLLTLQFQSRNVN
jgi:hypothetical protein